MKRVFVGSEETGIFGELMISEEKTKLYAQINLKVGLEVHQQLSTQTKLFCACPPYSGSESSIVIGSKETDSRFPIRFTRILRASSSELGEMDLAARFEARREIRVQYLTNNDSSCLVEADEEPPHPINEEALSTSLIFALALKSRIIDEIHVMRKIVVDGSNTSGFQRTAVVALGGMLEYNSGHSRIQVQSISVEEDAARAVKIDSANSNERTYILDRLGTPLVEVALAPIEGSPEEVQAAAGSLGRLMRSSGRIARGLGTIRQDLNVSVRGGNVIEVKGVQKLDQIAKVVEFEAARQDFFYELAIEIKTRLGDDLDISTGEVTDLFKESKSNVIKNALSGGRDSKVFCVMIKGFAGFLGKENAFHSRLGKELGSVAKAYGLGGIFHSDELPNYGVTSDEVAKTKSKFGLGLRDAFILLAGNSSKVANASEAVLARLRYSLKGVPAETRAATLDGETSFLRPRPGAARMYPETDIPLIRTTKEQIQELQKQIPEPWDKLVKEFGERYKLPPQLAIQLFESERKESFELAVRKTNLSPGFLAYSLVDTLQSLSRE